MKQTFWNRVQDWYAGKKAKINNWYLVKRHMTKCACGETMVSKDGSRAELRGVSHGITPCFVCDEYGKPV